MDHVATASDVMRPHDFEFWDAGEDVVTFFERLPAESQKIWQAISADSTAQALQEAGVSAVADRLREQMRHSTNPKLDARLKRELQKIEASRAENRKPVYPESKLTEFVKHLCKVEAEIGEKRAEAAKVAKQKEFDAAGPYKNEAEGVNRYKDVMAAGNEARKATSYTLKARVPNVPATIEKCEERLEIVQGGVGDLRDLIRHFELRPLPLEFVRQNAMKQLDSLISTAKAPDVRDAFRMVASAGGRRFPGAVKFAEKHIRGTADSFETDLAALVAWAIKPQLVKALDALLKEAAPDNGLGIAERAKEIADVNSRLVGLEFEEAALTWKLRTLGREVFWRPDLPPAAVLLVTVEHSSARDV